MKKLFPILLTVAFVLLLVSCGDDEEQTTLNITQPTATTTTQSSAETEGEGGIVLTTQFGQTVPTVETSNFDDTSAFPSANDPTGDEPLTVPVITAPIVVTDYVPTTIPPVTSSAALPSVSEESGSLTEPSTTGNISEAPEEGATSETNYTPSDVSTTTEFLVSIGQMHDDAGNVTIRFDYSGWERIKSEKARVNVTINGKTRSLRGTTNGVNDDNTFRYTVDISAMNPVEGDYIEISFPKSAIKTINGKQTSAATVISMTY